ncbi:MAG: tetratricopeptide repeat protein [Magnetococcales bacterium]|nr:SEC-C domain-containing protein [Magnetococcales bacterium]NGZ06668.1 tetratricopeptide repeat protein [Magnetococcales bacterium]
MGSPIDLNQAENYVAALIQAVQLNNVEALTRWLANDDQVDNGPFHKWYRYFAERLMAMAPRPEQGFAARTSHLVAPPKIGRNDPCPCGSGKKYKQCHLESEQSVVWKLGSPTPVIRAMATSQIIQNLHLDVLDNVPLEKCSALALAEMAAAYQKEGETDMALTLLKQMLDGDRDDPFVLIDYWIARYAEWLVEAGLAPEGERFLLEEFKNLRKVDAWQVAQKLAAFYIDQGNLESATSWVETALKEKPDNPFNHYLNGLLRHGSELWEQAIAAYEQAMALSAGFREQEQAYMVQLVNEALERARNRQPLVEEEEDNAESADPESEPSDQAIEEKG